MSGLPNPFSTREKDECDDVREDLRKLLMRIRSSRKGSMGGYQNVYCPNSFRRDWIDDLWDKYFGSCP